MFCRHDWEVLSEHVSNSLFRDSLEALKESVNGKVNIPHQLCRGGRKHIVIANCKKCGKIKRFVTNLD